MIQRGFQVDLEHGPLVGSVRIPEGPPPRAAVVLVHDFLGSAERGFMPWLAAELAADHAVVSYTSPGSGIGASGTHTELDRLASSTHTRELAELAHVVDATARGDWLTRPPRRLALVGHGRGGAHAILHAATDERVQALVTWAAPSRLDRWNPATRETWRREGRLYVPGPGTGQQLPLDVTLLEDTEARSDALSPLQQAEGVRVPWLLVQGTADLVVDEDEARSLAATCPSARLSLIAGGDHHFGGAEPFVGPGPHLKAALDHTRAHLRRHLDVGAPRTPGFDADR